MWDILWYIEFKGQLHSSMHEQATLLLSNLIPLFNEIIENEPSVLQEDSFEKFAVRHKIT